METRRIGSPALPGFCLLSGRSLAYGLRACFTFRALSDPFPVLRAGAFGHPQLIRFSRTGLFPRETARVAVSFFQISPDLNPPLSIRYHG